MALERNLTRLCQILLVLLALGGLALLPAAPGARAQTVAAISLSPAQISLAPRETVTVDVVVDDNVQSLYGAQFQLAFDAATLQVLDANGDAPGGPVMVGPLLAAELLETAGPDFVVARNRADNQLGMVDFTIAHLNPAPALDRGGVLARVTFQAVAGGRSELSLNNVLLSDHEGRSIPASATGGGVDVALPEAPDEATASQPAATATEAAPTQVESAPASETPSGNGWLVAVIAVVVGVVVLGLAGTLVMVKRRSGTTGTAATRSV